MKRNTRILSLLSAVLGAAMFVGCDLTENMQVKADKAMIFGSEAGLKAYSYSLYDMLPTTKSIFKQESGKCDYASCKTMNTFFVDGAYNAETSTSWSWTNLHKINYFIDGLKSDVCTVDDATKNHFLGIGRWFRAYFYYDKLKTYGEVPWFDHQIQNYEVDYMYKDRDSRDVIIENIIADLDFAYEHIQGESTGNSLISKYAAAALKSRVCLFEASFRKYHGISGEAYSAEDLYAECAEAASLVINSGKFKLNTSAGNVGAYRELFYNETPSTDESILSICANAESEIFGEGNWFYNSASYGNGVCGVRPFVLSFLMADGTPFTAKENYDLVEFKDEFTNRDLRLAQIFRGPSYKMDGKNVVPDIITKVAMTGYHVIKFSMDSKSYDNGAKNPVGMPMIRYAEVLLNYAEAKAELGGNEFTERDWANTIGAIRSRAGVKDLGLPTAVDTYMQETFYPDVTDAVIMEIRRERAIELYLEGFRMDDLRRWKAGRLFEDLPWTGIHIAALDAPIDINGDGTNDYYFSNSAVDSKSASKDIWIQLGTEADGLWVETNPNGGYDLVHKTVGGRKWYDDDRQYLYPVPAKVIRDYAAEGYKISQNNNW